MDQAFTALLQKDEALFTQKTSFFRLREDSHHGLAAYDKVDSRLDLTTFDVSLKFSPLNNFEIGLAFSQGYPMSYTRNTYGLTGAQSVVQDYKLNYLRDYKLDMRLRRGLFEPYFSVLEKTQKDTWHSSNYPLAPDYFTYIRSHFEDFGLGLRYLSVNQETPAVSNLSLLDRPLLDERQLSIDTQLDYRSGSLRRNSYYYVSGLLSVVYNMYQRLEHQYVPGVLVGYGMSKNMEVESGLAFSFPYKYFYEYRSKSSSGLTDLKSSYKTDRDFKVPLRLRYRPRQNLEIGLSSDTSYCRQRLDYWRVEADNTVTGFTSRKLDYFNTQPEINLIYLFERGKTVNQDPFANLTKTLLSGGQLLLKFSFRRDITILDKSDGNGPQNRIDPYNAFLYPLDYFVGGTEYATFFTGNNSGAAANVQAQNYNLFKLGLNYGLSDRFNAGATVGYRSRSRFHNFVVGGSSTYELKTRSYVLEPYWFFGLPCDWRLTKNTLLSLSWLFVPNYQTSMKIDGLTREFRSKTNYHSVSLSVRTLF